ncbi:MAG: lysylphosphatidylglycerol synthase transmembrane domain-containing protein [Myxococcota bacterium]|nr:lysylphosphatidylglycerol synthase transmembrane domain-containing protein [Myxococcota bacterium]
MKARLMSRQNITTAVGIAISVVLLVALFAHYGGAGQDRLSLGQIWISFGEAPPLGIAAVIVLHLIVLTFKACRWEVVLRSVPHPRGLPGARVATDPAARWLVFDSLFLGYFGNYVLPAKLGELGRSLLYSRRAEVAFPAILATIVFERIVDALVLVLFFFAASWFLPPGLPDWLETGARLVGIGGCMGLLVLYVLLRVLPSTGSEGAGLQERLSQLASKFRNGLSVLQRPRLAAAAVGWTILIWGVECFAVYVCIRTFVDEAPLQVFWTAAVLQTVISSFAIAAPSAPAGLGIHQWASVVVLVGAYEVGLNETMAVSFLVTGAVIFWTVPLGLFGLVRQGASLSELKGQARNTEGTGLEDD